MKKETRRAFKAILEWDQEAHNERVDHFFVTPVVKTILAGHKRYVVGRKGSGKSAIAKYISSLDEPRVFSKCLDFGNFPFEDLYNLPDNRFPQSSQYVTFWKYVILCGVVQMFVENTVIPKPLRKEIKQVFFPGGIKNLSSAMSHWNNLELGGSFLGTGATAKAGKETMVNEVSIRQKLEILKNFVLENIDTSKYFILFDDLDEGHEEMNDPEIRKKYTSLISSLFKAVEGIKRDFSQSNARIYPILFLRDDIFRIVDDNNRTKWLRNMVHLNWTKENLRKMIAHRIRVDGGFHPQLSDANVWNALVSRGAVKYHKGADLISKPIYKFMLGYTHYRPRDLIVFMQLAAEYAVHNRNNSDYKLTPACFKNVVTAFSEYMTLQLEDELLGILPNRKDILDSIRQKGKRKLLLKDFEEICAQDNCKHNFLSSSPKELINTLFRFGFLANPNFAIKHDATLPKMKFSHLGFKKINVNSPLIVHRGFCDELGI